MVLDADAAGSINLDDEFPGGTTRQAGSRTQYQPMSGRGCGLSVAGSETRKLACRYLAACHRCSGAVLR